MLSIQVLFFLLNLVAFVTDGRNEACRILFRKFLTLGSKSNENKFKFRPPDKNKGFCLELKIHFFIVSLNGFIFPLGGL